MNKATLRVRWWLVGSLGIGLGCLILSFFAARVAGEWAAVTLQSAMVSGDYSEFWAAFIVVGTVLVYPLPALRLVVCALVLCWDERARRNGTEGSQ